MVLSKYHKLILEFFAFPYSFPHLSSSSLCACGNIVGLLCHTARLGSVPVLCLAKAFIIKANQ